MDVSELRRRFEDLTLTGGEFSHREHVRLAWSYLREESLLDVLRIFPQNLRRFATSLGATGLYHETITWAYLMLIDERMKTTAGDGSWETFIAANEDLLSKDLLHCYYDPGTLASPEAKLRFVFPKRSRS